MNSTERFKKIMDILQTNHLSTNGRNFCFFEKISNRDLNNTSVINDVISNIKTYDNALDNNPNNYPEHIMQYLRQRRGLDSYDTSFDAKLNEMSKSNVFKEVLNWNGLLGGYDATIKDWVKSIYGIDLDADELNH